VHKPRAAAAGASARSTTGADVALGTYLRQQTDIARSISNLLPSAFASMVLLGGGFGFCGLTGSLQMFTGKLSSKGAVTFTLRAVAGPNAGPPVSAVLADGGALSLVPHGPSEMEDSLRIMGDIQFGFGDSTGGDPHERLRLMANWESAMRLFRRRLTDLLDGVRDGPWDGHPDKCAFYKWVGAFLVLYRAISHTVLVDKDPATLCTHIDRLWNMAHAGNVFPSDPSTIAPRDLLAAAQLAGLSCEVCHVAGAMAQICWKCKRNTFGGGRKENEAEFRRARDAWQKADPARATLTSTEVYNKFRATSEGKALSGAAATTAHTAVECMKVLALKLNKIQKPLQGPAIKYK
jgi:hypothetical protein